MENQHRKISGYRELSQEEIDLMNRIKTKGAELLALQDELTSRLAADEESKRAAALRSLCEGELNECTGKSSECDEFRRFMATEPFRWASIGKTDIQTGIMALVRAVAQPDGV